MIAWPKWLPAKARRIRKSLLRNHSGPEGVSIGPEEIRKIKDKKAGIKYICEVHEPHNLARAIAAMEPGACHRFAVNIGAGDGVACNDPVYPLYKLGWGGIAIEGAREPDLHANLPNPEIRKLDDTMVFPENVASLLSKEDCPRDPDFLKIDIDGYDGPVLEAILAAGYRPKVIQIEVQPEFPPPIEFAVLYDPDYRVHDDDGGIGGFYGTSIAYVVNRARPYGYRPAYIDFVTPWTHDVTLVAEEYTNIAVALYGRDLLDLSLRERFLRHAPGHSHFAEEGIETRSWRTRTDWDQLLKDVREACETSSRTKHFGKLIAHHLSIGE